MLACFELVQLGEHRFAAGAVFLADRRNLFGGQLLSQAIVAASRTLPDREWQPHSAHIDFLAEGRFDEPVTFEVVSSRTGRNFAGRLVTGLQGATTVVQVGVSFTRGEVAVDHPAAAEGPPAPIISSSSVINGRRWVLGMETVYDSDASAVAGPDSWVWVRPNGTIAGLDAITRSVLVAYVSDLRSSVPVVDQHGLRFGDWSDRMLDRQPQPLGLAASAGGARLGLVVSPLHDRVGDPRPALGDRSRPRRTRTAFGLLRAGAPGPAPAGR